MKCEMCQLLSALNTVTLKSNFCLSGNIVANNSVTICDRLENVNFPTKAAVSK